ncbi:MAG: carbohydrate ABC transporter permease [Ruminococcus sp.]|nr:carbohydrate ABC transporter permease [Ruminococcus sp.]
MASIAKKEKVYGTHLKVSTKHAGHKVGGTIGIFIFLLILALFMALPIYLAVVMSLKPVQELFVFPPKLYVIDPTLSNFTTMFRMCSDLWVPFSRYVFNSVFVTLVVTVFQVLFSAMAAFCMAKVRFPGAKALNSIIVISLLYQSNVIYIMQYIVLAQLGMIDTYMALIFPCLAAPMNLYLMRQSIGQIPDAMLEAAKVDGAGLFRICWQIVMPNEKPALMTIIIFSFQTAWNIQGGTMVFDESLKTLPTVVQQAASAGLARAGVAMAAAVFMLIPPIVVFMLAQRQVIETMAHSGIKD